MSLIVLYFLYSTSVLSFYIDVVLTLSMGDFPSMCMQLTQFKLRYIDKGYLGTVPANDNKRRTQNIEGHIAHTNVSWPKPKQSQMGHTSDLMMIIRWSKRILTITTREMGKLNTAPGYSPIYCMKDKWENRFNFRHTIDRIYPISILESFTVCSMTMIMITGPHIFSVAFINCKNWVLRVRWWQLSRLVIH